MKNDLMIALSLSDGTRIFSSDFQVGTSAILVEKFKYHRVDENPTLVEEPTTIHKDAARVYFVIHEGGLENGEA